MVNKVLSETRVYTGEPDISPWTYFPRQFPLRT